MPALIVAAYVITGGIKGVLYTDALQAVIMFACMLFLLFWFYRVMDMGFIEANRKLTEITPLVPERFKEVGHQGWTAMPVTGSPQWYTLVTSLILGVGIGCLAQPQLVVRFMNANSTMGVRIGVLCSILVSYIICYTLSAGVIARGTALFMGICAATFLPAYFCSFSGKRRPKKEHWLVYGRGRWQVCLPCCFFTRRKQEQSAYAICCLGVMF